MTDTLLPRSLRGTAFYKSFLANTQNFLIHDLGEVPSDTKTIPEGYLPRKLVGNIIDGAGIFAFRFSPMWFFLLVGDAAGGASEYLQRIVKDLESEGALPAGTPADSAVELLNALSKASMRTSAPFDTPPLSLRDLATLRDQMAADYAELYAQGKKSIPSLKSLWSMLDEVSRRQKVPRLRLYGTLALAASRAAGRATGAMFAEKVVGSYSASLAEVNREGFAAFFRREAKPYLDTVGKSFSITKKSWTEKLFAWELFSRPAPRNPSSERTPPER